VDAGEDVRRREVHPRLRVKECSRFSGAEAYDCVSVSPVDIAPGVDELVDAQNDLAELLTRFEALVRRTSL
jgi:hypothetical protein